MYSKQPILRRGTELLLLNPRYLQFLVKHNTEQVSQTGATCAVGVTSH